mmetsp:Transcript_41525/g.91269  ORF Transcript_41525/g.91269 Transcript_41525/m.91269 type:complete len:249 (-) Transcript_41525:1108-1854(-)
MLRHAACAHTPQLRCSDCLCHQKPASMQAGFNPSGPVHHEAGQQDCKRMRTCERALHCVAAAPRRRRRVHSVRRSQSAHAVGVHWPCTLRNICATAAVTGVACSNARCSRRCGDRLRHYTQGTQAKDPCKYPGACIQGRHQNALLIAPATRHAELVARASATRPARPSHPHRRPHRRFRKPLASRLHRPLSLDDLKGGVHLPARVDALSTSDEPRVRGGRVNEDALLRVDLQQVRGWRQPPLAPRALE